MNNFNFKKPGLLTNIFLIALFVLLAFSLYFYSLNIRNASKATETSQQTINNSKLLNPVNARIRMSLFGNTLSLPGAQGHIHTTNYINNREYSGLSDNDLRGFLDGNNLHPWNQSTQIHLRIGRRGKNPKKGEYELFRVLQKWQDVYLPEHSKVNSASIKISIEKFQESPVNVMLYNINKNWNPGEGGIKRNNNSTPKTGEVWWGELSANVEQWGLPGAGFSSDNDANADRPLMPLAVKTYYPGDKYLELSSKQLAKYIEKQTTDNKPLLFLLKLSDYDEDKKSSRIEIYSAEQGDDLNNNDRRPKLTINWTNNRTVKVIEKDILLEYGKYYYFPKVNIENYDSVVLDTLLYENSDTPIIEIRSSINNKISNWSVISHAMKINNWNWFEIRVSQLKNKVVLGSPFEVSFRDTWVVTAKPEKQIVAWTFISPEGEHHKIEAQYDGDNTWSIQFFPDTLGRWNYYWNSNFVKTPYTSETGTFDVVPGNKDNITTQLTILLEQIKNIRTHDDSDITDQYFEKFSRLERAFMETQTPDTFISSHSQTTRNILNEIRKAIDPHH